MKFYIGLFSLLLSSTFCYSQTNDLFTIEYFKWLPKRQAFMLQGRTKLPPRTKLKASLLLNEHIGSVRFLWVKRNGWRGYFGPFRNKKLFPGQYRLRVTLAKAQRPDVKKKLDEKFRLPDDYEKLVATQEFSYQQGAVEKSWEELRDKVRDELFSCRKYYDRLMLEGHLLVWRADGATSSQKKALVDQWQETTKMLSKLYAKEQEWRQYQNQHVMFPYDEAVKSLVTVFDQIQQLRFALSKKLAEATGMPVPESKTGPLSALHLARHVHDRAQKILDQLGFEQLYWSYQLDIPAERGTFDPRRKRYTSLTSKFRFSYATDVQKYEQGEENRPDRLTMIFSMATLPAFLVQVQMVEFPGVRTEEEKIKAWELLASYEWEHYDKKSSRYIEVKGGKRGRETRKIYELVFTSYTRRIVRQVKTYLFFSRKREEVVYAVMYINLLGTDMGHHGPQDLLENIDRILATFQVMR